ncbi:PH domain-containing protein [Haloprofundus salilacus]|uniref:PH domain-containing protein n=1 Tax=Haloprofundus salilacus TaxID=2876190 RepID=UPI001CC9181F|nr:PH domain-containing protein [Haloprofundus salilacus]
MSRGLPAAWSALFGLPLVVVGGYIYGFQSQYPLVEGQATAPPIAGVLLAAFGLFVCGLGTYVQFVGAPPAPTMRASETFVDDRDPAQRNALAQAFASVPFLASGIALLYFTAYPLVYPTLTLALGLYLFSTGILRYWRNTLTTYLVTNQRVIEEYRFLSLVRNELSLEKVRAVEERRSMRESIAGLGSVHVRAGASGGLTVTINDVYDSTKFADVIRAQLGTEESSENGDVLVTNDNAEHPNTELHDGTPETIRFDGTETNDTRGMNDEYGAIADAKTNTSETESEDVHDSPPADRRFDFDGDVRETRREDHVVAERANRVDTTDVGDEVDSVDADDTTKQPRNQ